MKDKKKNINKNKIDTKNKNDINNSINLNVFLILKGEASNNMEGNKRNYCSKFKK